MPYVPKDIKQYTLMINYLIVFLGGGLGSLCRFLLSTYVTKSVNSFFPMGTLTVNLIGSFIIGFCYELFERYIVPSEVRILLTTGFLGGFTTFSTFALENTNLLRDGEYRYFLINLLTSNAAGVLFAFAGIMFIRIIFKFVMR
ncbi:MAG: fluoride efflux transporter CrcB [Spirochaetia bacterium]|nr:fluoride efflux transporter CrcB [Spirochaetia bacterium]